jgi:hypothetical protein
MTILLGIRLNEVDQKPIAFLDLNVTRISRMVTHHPMDSYDALKRDH